MAKIADERIRLVKVSICLVESEDLTNINNKKKKSQEITPENTPHGHADDENLIFRVRFKTLTATQMPQLKVDIILDFTRSLFWRLQRLFLW